MSKKRKPSGPALTSWWTQERRQAVRELRKAKPQGTRSPEWWAAHPEHRDRVVEAMRVGRERWIERRRQERAAEAGRADGD